MHKGSDQALRVMFEKLRIIGSRELKIVLQTRLGTSIENSQAPEPDEQDIRKFEQIFAKHKHGWTLRKKACGIYNCFGLVWAARRIGIYEQKEVKTILKDDGYRRLSTGEKSLYGDIALYYSPPPDAEIWHAGLVCELREFHNLDISPVPWVLSKLNSVCGEVLHNAMDVHSPYKEGDGHRLEYWTDRPMGEN